LRSRRGRRSPPGEHRARTVLGFLELSLDRPTEAAAHLAQVATDLRDSGVEEPGAFQHRNDVMEALIAAGRIEEAERALAEMKALGERLNRPRLLCVTRRAEAMLAAHRRSPA
jgi:pentatricopeptide repeat protein